MNALSFTAGITAAQRMGDLPTALALYEEMQAALTQCNSSHRAPVVTVVIVVTAFVLYERMQAAWDAV